MKKILLLMLLILTNFAHADVSSASPPCFATGTEIYAESADECVQACQNLYKGLFSSCDVEYGRCGETRDDCHYQSELLEKGCVANCGSDTECVEDCRTEEKERYMECKQAFYECMDQHPTMGKCLDSLAAPIEGCMADCDATEFPVSFMVYTRFCQDAIPEFTGLGIVMTCIGLFLLIRR